MLPKSYPGRFPFFRIACLILETDTIFIYNNSTMSRIIFDIETVGKDFESLDTTIQEYLLRYAETDDEKEEIKDRLSFYPLTAEIVTIGLLEPESQKGFVFFQTTVNLCFRTKRITYYSSPERKRSLSKNSGIPSSTTNIL
jgi:hypothetical protein